MLKKWYRKHSKCRRQLLLHRKHRKQWLLLKSTESSDFCSQPCRTKRSGTPAKKKENIVNVGKWHFTLNLGQSFAPFELIFKNQSARTCVHLELKFVDCCVSRSAELCLLQKIQKSPSWRDGIPYITIATDLFKIHIQNMLKMLN